MAHEMVGFLSIELHWLDTLQGSVDAERLRTITELVLAQQRTLARATGRLTEQWRNGESTDEETTRAIRTVLTQIAERLRQAAELWDPTPKA